MLKPYVLLESVLNDIEEGLNKDINIDYLSEKYYLSSTHLRRLFKFAFGQTIGTYIRSRKLAASINDLINTDLNILDIAMEYGLGYEQSYIRAFKREFGITPGELRKTGQIVVIKPPLHLFGSNRLEDGVFFGPDIVIIPQFHVAGKLYKLPFRDSLSLPRFYKERFINNERMYIPNKINHDVLIGINRDTGLDADYHLYMPSVQVKSFDNIPEEFNRYTFPSSLCARFHFIGPNDITLNMAVADGMFKAIDDFMDDENQKYFLERKRVNIDKFSLTCDGNYKLWEWFAPVIEKNKENTPINSTGIKKVYKQETPELRFIGKKYRELFKTFSYKKILDNLDNWCSNIRFEAIEKQLDKDIKTLFDGGDAYISLIRKNDDDSIEYWLGMFTPKGTAVPEGYEMIDFPKSTLGVCAVYGKRDAIINYDAECRKMLTEEKIYKEDETNKNWFIMRFNWHRFFEEDKFGKRILEYCYYL